MLGLLTTLAASSSSTSSGSPYTLVLFFVLIGGFFYFLLIRPQQKRARAQRSLIESVDVGDEVMTIGGVYGTIRGVDDESFTVEIAPGTDIRVVKSAIARKLVYEEYDEDEDGEDDEHDHDHDDDEHQGAGDQA